jgi:hypothetical protein
MAQHFEGVRSVENERPPASAGGFSTSLDGSFLQVLVSVGGGVVGEPQGLTMEPTGATPGRWGSGRSSSAEPMGPNVPQVCHRSVTDPSLSAAALTDLSELHRSAFHKNQSPSRVRRNLLGRSMGLEG